MKAFFTVRNLDSMLDTTRASSSNPFLDQSDDVLPQPHNQVHCKNSFGEIRIIYICNKGPFAVRNKCDLDSGIKTKTSNLGL